MGYIPVYTYTRPGASKGLHRPGANHGALLTCCRLFSSIYRSAAKISANVRPTERQTTHSCQLASGARVGDSCTHLLRRSNPILFTSAMTRLFVSHHAENVRVVTACEYRKRMYRSRQPTLVPPASPLRRPLWSTYAFVPTTLVINSALDHYVNSANRMNECLRGHG